MSTSRKLAVPARRSSAGGRSADRRFATRGRPCPVAAALDVVGDTWSLLIVRELLFGNHRFDEIVANTGAPRDRVAARLRDLTDAGVVVRERYSERPERFEYRLSQSGRDLGPVLNALRGWGDRWAVDPARPAAPDFAVHPLDAAPLAVDRPAADPADQACAHQAGAVTVCRQCNAEAPW
jgi:DNA-binding HxlR family transcriptional regulator